MTDKATPADAHEVYPVYNDKPNNDFSLSSSDSEEQDSLDAPSDNEKTAHTIKLYLTDDWYNEATETLGLLQESRFSKAIKDYASQNTHACLLIGWEAFFKITYISKAMKSNRNSVNLNHIAITPLQSDVISDKNDEISASPIISMLDMLQSDSFIYAAQKTSLVPLIIPSQYQPLLDKRDASMSDVQKNVTYTYNKKKEARTSYLWVNPITTAASRNPMKTLAVNTVTSAAVGGAVGAGLFAAYLSLSGKAMGAGALAGTLVAGPLGGLIAAVVIGALVAGGAALVVGSLVACSMFRDNQIKKKREEFNEIQAHQDGLVE
ncbi:MAG: complement resistance protein TraT [Gammaproteobacteria bacterium]|nr:complement resistance protein TraT [Gammaproteobacteria bacterium]